MTCEQALSKDATYEAAHKLIEAARRLQANMTEEDRQNMGLRVRKVLEKERLKQEDRAQRLKMTPADYDFVYSL